MNPLRTLFSARRMVLGCALAATLLTTGSAVAGAAVREVPQEYPTIQDAVDASNPGDTVAISKKLNFQNVTVATPNLLIKGVKKGVVVDGYINGVGNNYQFLINSNNVRIVNLGMRNGYGIYCNGVDRCAAKKLRYSGENDGDCFYAAGDAARVIRSALRNCGSLGVSISGDDAVVRGNSVQRSDSGCVSITGDDATVARNSVAGCEDNDGIYVAGDRALVERNFGSRVDGSIVELSGLNARVFLNRGGTSYDDCYRISSDRARVRGNAGTHCGEDGFDLDGDDLKVNDNRITSADGYGYYLSCPASCGQMEVSRNVLNGTVEDDYGMYFSVADGGLLITRNVLNNATDTGMYLSGVDTSRISRNVVRSAGSESEESFYLVGEGNTFTENTSVNGGGDGIAVFGDNNRLEENLARGNGGDGIYLGGVYQGQVLLRNVAIGNGADGIENDATGTILRKNRASGSHRDCANDGTIAVKQGNRCADGSNFNEPGTASRVGR